MSRKLIAIHRDAGSGGKFLHVNWKLGHAYSGINCLILPFHDWIDCVGGLLYDLLQERGNYGKYDGPTLSFPFFEAVGTAPSRETTMLILAFSRDYDHDLLSSGFRHWHIFPAAAIYHL
jgi:hypothetical protein